MTIKTVEVPDHEMRVSYEVTDDLKQEVFDAVIAWYFKQTSFNGETIMQCDAPIIDAPAFLSHLADDIIKFKVEYEV